MELLCDPQHPQCARAWQKSEAPNSLTKNEQLAGVTVKAG